MMSDKKTWFFKSFSKENLLKRSTKFPVHKREGEREMDEFTLERLIHTLSGLAVKDLIKGG